MTLERTVEPTEEPVSLQEAWQRLRLDSDDTDSEAEVAGLIVAAREWCEDYTNRALITQTWTQKLDDFPSDNDDPVRLLKVPVQSVTDVTYLDSDGASQTWNSSKYQVERDGLITRVLPAPDEAYPDTEDERANAVTITFKAGYGDNWNAVPYKLRLAMLLHIQAHFDADGEVIETMLKTARALAGTYRVHWF